MCRSPALKSVDLLAKPGSESTLVIKVITCNYFAFGINFLKITSTITFVNP